MVTYKNTIQKKHFGQGLGLGLGLGLRPSLRLGLGLRLSLSLRLDRWKCCNSEVSLATLALLLLYLQANNRIITPQNAVKIRNNTKVTLKYDRKLGQNIQ